MQEVHVQQIPASTSGQNNCTVYNIIAKDKSNNFMYIANLCLHHDSTTYNNIMLFIVWLAFSNLFLLQTAVKKHHWQKEAIIGMQ